jgi:hypothetical protein
MGLLTLEAGANDVQALISCVRRVADIWNESRAVDFGFRLMVGEDESRNACEIGTRILGKFFADPPSAFKRTAAVLVIGRLFPFIGPAPEPRRVEDYHRWMARIMFLLMPSVLASIKVKLTPCTPPRTESFVRLPRFKKWPSRHVRAEFMEWMTSLDSFPWLAVSGREGAGHFADPRFTSMCPWLTQRPTQDELQAVVSDKRLERIASWMTNLPSKEDLQDFYDQRLARMIMATSLIIENAYYCMECQPDEKDRRLVRNQCYTCIEKIGTDLDLTFEHWIIE